MGDLNGLIKALREEIAIAGENGANVGDILTGIDTFYKQKAKLSTEDESPLQKVDRAFQERVWTWIAKDRLVRVGKDNEGNTLSLSEIEARNCQENPLRLFTTLQQIWITLTGHEKDSRKVPAKSFELLQLIAAHKERGITQPELVKITGQDKRSVPLRTQRLADAGLVKKIPVLANHSNTSLLILTRFIDDFAVPATGEQIAVAPTSEAAPERLFLGHNRFVRAERQIREAIVALEENNGLLMWTDLKLKVNVFDQPTSKVLAEGIRRLEQLGVTARVRASASLEKYNALNPLHRCIQLLRPATEHDWRTLFEWTKHEQSKLAIPLPQADDTQEELAVGLGHEATDSLLVEDETAKDLYTPTWNPDRLLTHTVRSALLAVGTTGLATKDLKRVVTGPCYFRPIDRFLDRCVWRWQQSQSYHLRHLAIVRDSAQMGRTSFYVHFTHDAFGIKVNNQETIWEAVQSFPEPTEPFLYDNYGFGAVPSSTFVGQRNDMTLRQALEAAGSARHALKFEEGVIRGKPKWNRMRTNQAKDSRQTSKEQVSKKKTNPILAPVVLIGRPRKYPTGDTVDFSKMTHQQIRTIRTSQQRAQEYLRKKARKQVEEDVALGVPRAEAVETALAELGLTPEAFVANTIKIPPIGSSKPNNSRKRKRGIKKIQYLPSIAAHTIPHYQSVDTTEPAHKKQKQMGSQIRRQSLISTESGYLPSIATHSDLSQPFTKAVLPFQAKQRQTKSKVRKQKQNLARLGYLPSMLAHTQPTLEVVKNLKVVPETAKNQKSNTTQVQADSESLKHIETSVVAPYKAIETRLLQVYPNSPPPGFTAGTDIVSASSRLLTNSSREKSDTSRTVPLPDKELVVQENDEQQQGLSHAIDSNINGVGTAATQPRISDNTGELSLQPLNEQSNLSTHIHTDTLIHASLPSIMPFQEDYVAPSSSLGSNAPVREPVSQIDAPDTSLVLSKQSQENKAKIQDENGVIKSNTTTSDFAANTNGIHTENVPEPKAPSLTLSNSASPSKQKIKAQSSRIAPFGGTIAAMRKLIILGIVRNCGGSFPGDGELVYPFLTAYVKKFPEAKPDSKTIKFAKTTLIGEGVLKQIFFTCKSPSGLVQSKSIIALPEIPDTDQRIKNLQQAMAKQHPHPYFPLGTNIRPDLIPKAASYNASTDPTLRLAQYANQLPVISDLVVPHYPWKSHGKSSRKVSQMELDHQDATGEKTASGRSLGRQKKLGALYGNQTTVKGDVAQTSDNEEMMDVNDQLPIESDSLAQRQSASGRFNGEDPSAQVEEQSSRVPKRKRRAANSQQEHTELNLNTSSTALTLGPHAEVEQSQLEAPKAKRQRRVSKKSSLVDDVDTIEDSHQTEATPKLPRKRVSDVDLRGQSEPRRRRRPNASSSYEIQTANNDVSTPHTKSKKSGKSKASAKGRTVADSVDLSPSSTTLVDGSGILTASLDQLQSPEGSELIGKPKSLTRRSKAAALSIYDNLVNHPLSDDHHVESPNEDDLVSHEVVGTQVSGAEKKRERGRPKANTLADSTKNRKKRKVSHLQDTEGNAEYSAAEATPKLSALENLAQKGEKTPGVRYSKGKENRPRPVQTRRARYQWDPVDDKKLLIASLFGHVALGGIREENHWGIVSRMLGHKYERELCRRRWAVVRTKYRNDMEVIAADLRVALLNSYESGDAPKLDFANFWDNNWTAIFTWAFDKIENPQVGDIELPTSREAFDSTFLVQDFPKHDSPDILESKRVASVPLRLSVLNASPRILQDMPEAKMSEIQLARTYIRANILTPQETYDATDAKAKLQQFSEAVIDEAINELQMDRVISQANKGRALPGRGYDVSVFFLKAIQWKLNVTHFKYATAFKEILDKRFQDNGKIEYKSAFGNGEMITMLNLLADDYIRLDGKNIPSSKFGLTKEGYRTRTMDKKVFNFDIYAEPTGSYSSGIPYRPLPPPPTKTSDVVGQHIITTPVPLWIDINGDIVSIMWDYALAAVGTVLTILTAADAEHIAEKLQPCIAEFEVQMIMQWLVDAGAAEWKDGKQDVLNLTTYWWSIITTPIARVGTQGETIMIAGAPLE